MPIPQALYRDRWRLLKPNLGPTRFYNPSVLRVGSKTWMAYRADMDGHPHLSRIAACTLDEQWNPEVSSNRCLALPSYYDRYCVEDPRLFAVQKDVYISYTDGRRTALARLDAHFGVDDAWYCETDFKLQSVEKNWIFFAYGTGIKVIYSLQPHAVMSLDFENERPFCSRQFVTDWPFKWAYGTPRGGAPPVLHDGYYWHFFHSHVVLENDVRRYYAGVYIFESKPPFRPLAICNDPILIGTRENLPPGGTFQVVFPAGVLRETGGWRVAFGRNDLDCCIAHVLDCEYTMTWL